MMASLQTLNLWYRRAPWMIGAAAVTIALVSHFFTQRPAGQRLQALSREHATAAAELAAARAALVELPRVQREVEEMRRKLASARKLPQHQDLGQFYRDMNAFAQEAELSKLTVQPGVPRQRELISEIPVSLSFEGDYLGVCAFLRRAEEMPRLTAMRGLSIKGLDPMAGRVEVQLSMNLYFADGY